MTRALAILTLSLIAACAALRYAPDAISHNAAHADAVRE